MWLRTRRRASHEEDWSGSMVNAGQIVRDPRVSAWVSSALVALVVAGGVWVVAFGLPSGAVASWWVFASTVVLLVAAVVGQRYVYPREMSLLKKCLVVSVLLHVLIAMGLSGVHVTRQVVEWVQKDEPMVPSVNLELSREMSVREEVRGQAVDVPMSIPTPFTPPQHVDSPLPEMGGRIEAVGVPGAEMRQRQTVMNPIAPTLPQAAPAERLMTPLLPVRPELAPMPETTKLPAVPGKSLQESSRMPGMVVEPLARASSPLPGAGVGALGAPPAALPFGEGGGGSATGAGTGKPYSLVANTAPPRAGVPTNGVANPLAARPDTALSRNSDLLTPRSFDQRQKQLQETGGTNETEAAVARALVFLSRMQHSDGHWTRNTEKANGPTTDEHDVGITSLAVLSFLAADHTPEKAGPYQETVQKGLNYLLSKEKKDGDLRGEGNMYDQGIATLALGEAAAMTGDKRLRDAAHRGAQFIVDSQGNGGGWRYVRQDLFNDASSTGWQVMGLHSAERTGFVVPAEVRAKTLGFLDKVSTGKQGMLTGYLMATPTVTMTAEGLFSRMLFNQKLTAAQLEEAAEYLTARLPGKGEELNYYYIYYGSLALMQVQDEHWTKWNGHTSRMLLELQERAGAGAGSFAPEGEWADRGGRIYTTAMATLSLEVYYRYLPMYGRKK